MGCGVGGYRGGLRLNQLIGRVLLKYLYRQNNRTTQSYYAGYESPATLYLVCDLFDLCPNTLTDLFSQCVWQWYIIQIYSIFLAVPECPVKEL